MRYVAGLQSASVYVSTVKLGRRSRQGYCRSWCREEVSTATSRSPDGSKGSNARRPCLSCFCWCDNIRWLERPMLLTCHRFNCRWASTHRQGTDRMSEPPSDRGGSCHGGIHHSLHCWNPTGPSPRSPSLKNRELNVGITEIHSIWWFQTIRHLDTHCRIRPTR